MNASMPEKIGPDYFLKVIEDFKSKKTVHDKEVIDFCKIIRKGTATIDQPHTPHPSKSQNSSQDKIVRALIDLGKNSAVLLTATKAVQVEFKNAIDSALELFSIEHEKKSDTVNRKERTTRT